MSRSTPTKRSLASFSQKLRPLLIVLALTHTTVTLADTNDPYYAMIYDFETASFCGLVAKGVYDAFWTKRRAFEATSPRDVEELRQTRIRAMAAADREFDNRGLGGHKQWCQGEVTEGIGRLLED